MSDVKVDTPVKEQPAVVTDETTNTGGQVTDAAALSAAATPVRLNANAKSFVPIRLDEGAVAAAVNSAAAPTTGATPSAVASTTKSSASGSGGGGAANQAPRKERSPQVANTPSASSGHQSGKRGSNAGQKGHPITQHPPMPTVGVGLGGLPLPPGLLPHQFAPPFGAHPMMPGQPSPMPMMPMMMNPVLVGQPNLQHGAHMHQGGPQQQQQQAGTPSHAHQHLPPPHQQHPHQQHAVAPGGGIQVGGMPHPHPIPHMPHIPQMIMGPNGQPMINPALVHAHHAFLLQQQQQQQQQQHDW